MGEWTWMADGIVVYATQGVPCRVTVRIEADVDAEDLRQAIEARYGVWLERVKWLDVEADEWLGLLIPHDTAPTHVVTSTPDAGEPRIWVVRLDDGSAYTRSEWDACQEPSWTVMDGKWLHGGSVTPDRASAVVEVTPVALRRGAAT